MKILHLVSSNGYYGKEAVIVNLCSALQNAGCVSEVGAFLNSRSPNEEIIARAGDRKLEARTFACRGRIDWRTVSDIRRHMVDRGIELLHCHDYKANLYGLLAARSARRPVYATCHLWYCASRADRFYSRLDLGLLRYFDGVIAVSAPIGETLRKAWISREKIGVIANGIDVEKFFSISQESPEREFGNQLTIGIIGRLVPQKGHTVLLRAFSKILATLPNTTLVMVGDGPDREKIQGLAQTLGIESKLVFAGYRPDMAKVLQSIDLVAMPSFDEGLPMTLLESMAAARPVIATRVGAVPEVIEHRQNGLLLDPGDVPALVEAILEMIGNPLERERMAKNARLSAARFSSAHMAGQYLKFYHRSDRCLSDFVCRTIT